VKISKNTAIFGLIFLTLAVLEFVLFKRYCRHFLVPYYPVNYDQMATFYWDYSAHFSLSQLGHWPADNRALTPFKGALVPMLGLLFTFIFGAHRLSILLVNFFFLLLAQFFLFFWAVKRNFSMSFLSVGFFLLTGTHFFYFGGLNDMRLDYGGMVMMGLAFLAALNWLQFGGRKCLVWVGTALALLDLTRFVTMFYWIGGLPVAMAVACGLVARTKKRGSFAAKLPKRLATVWLLAIGVATLHLLISWVSFSNYYVALKITGEDKMRWTEFGVHNIFEQILYFPNSFLIHFHETITFFLILLIPPAVTLFYKRLAAGNSGKSNVDIVEISLEKTSWLLFLSLLATTYIALTLYSPSPIVIGVYAIPLCVSMALTLSRLLATVFGKKIALSVSVLFMMFGAGTFMQRLYAPTEPPHCNSTSSQRISAINTLVVEQVAASKKIQTILWSATHEGLMPLQFTVSWSELKHCLQPPVIQIHVPPYPALDESDFVAALNEADIAVIPITLPSPPPGWFEYPNITALRTHLPVLKTCLDREFKLVQRFDQIYAGNPNLWSIGVYKRIKNEKDKAGLKTQIVRDSIPANNRRLYLLRNMTVIRDN